MLLICDGFNGVGQVWDCESVATGGGWPRLSTCSSPGAPIHLFNSWMPVFPPRAIPSMPRLFGSQRDCLRKKKQSMREMGEADHMRVTVWCFRTRFQSVQTATLSFLLMQKTSPGFIFWQFVCVCFDICTKYVFVCSCWCGLFEDVHSKTGRRAVGGIKVLTPLH